MSLFISPKEAAKSLLCPLSRTFGDEPLSSTCRGDKCALWRWKPQLTSDPGWKPAIAREMALRCDEYNESIAGTTKQKRTPDDFHKSAVAAVARNPEGFGITREEGYCGLGGPVS